MLRLALCGVFVAALVHLSVAQQVNLADEPGLQKRITVWLKMEPMRDALREIARQTGVPLRCQDAIQHEKVAIFVENRPAHEILTQLTRLFHYAWRKLEEGGYLLFVPDETRAKEEKIVRITREVRQKAFRELVAAAREVARMTPEQRKTELGRLQKKFQKESLSPQELVRYTVLSSWQPITYEVITESGEVETREMMSAQTSLYHCLAALTDTAVQALLNGQTVGFSTQPARGIYLLPTTVLFPEWLRDFVYEEREEGRLYLRNSQQNSEFSGLWIRLSPILNTVEFRFVVYQRSPHIIYTPEGQQEQMRFSLQEQDDALGYQMLPYLKQTAFWREWESWATPRKQLEQLMPVKPRDGLPERPEPVLPIYRDSLDMVSRGITTADALEWLAWGTGRPLISDAFRTQQIWLRDYATLRNPKALMTELVDTLWLRSDETGYLLARHHHYWSRRRYEIAEHLIRPIEHKYKQEKWLSLEDCIDFAGKLTDLQVEYLLQGGHSADWLYPLTSFDFVSIANALPALRFLASLNPLQKQRALSGEWFPVRLLTLPQQQRFAQIFENDFPPAEKLFREVPAAMLERGFSRPEQIVYSRWLWNCLSLGRLESPPEPSFRLTTLREVLSPCAVNEQGILERSFGGCLEMNGSASEHSALNEWSIKEMREFLQKHPTSRLMAVRQRRISMEFVRSPDQRKWFVLAQWQFEPYQLPEAGGQ